MINVKQYEPMLNSQAAFYAKKYKLDFDEVKSQAYLIFCETLEKYDNRKASFTTFLYARLHDLNRLAYSESASRIFYDSGETDFDKIPFTYFSNYSPVEKAKGKISPDAFTTIKVIASGQLYKPEHQHGRGRAGSMGEISKRFNWSTEYTKRIFEEIKIWWRKEYPIIEGLQLC